MSEPIELIERTVDGCIVLDIAASNFTYPETGIVKSHVASLLEKGFNKIAMNVSQVSIIDSYGLATIVSVLKLIQEAKGGLVLFGLNTNFEQLVKMTQLTRVLEIWPNEAQAVYYLSTLNPTSR